MTPEEVAAAAMFLKDSLDKESVHELIANLAKDSGLVSILLASLAISIPIFAGINNFSRHNQIGFFHAQSDDSFSFLFWLGSLWLQMARFWWKI